MPSVEMICNMEDLTTKYCFCELNAYPDPEQHIDLSNMWNCSVNQNNNTKPRKSSRISLISLYKNLYKLVNLINSFDDGLVFFGKQKSSGRANASAKRTSYYGVSKNGPNWQTLISINKKKTYVGTFMTEREAGEAYDFYSILLNGSKALTNFSYTKSQVSSLITKFSHLVDHDF